MEERKTTRKLKEEDDDDEEEKDDVEEEEGEEDEDLVLEEAEDSFFNSMDRVPSGVSVHFGAHSSDSESDDEDDVRFSFASAVGPPSFRRISFSVEEEELVDHGHEAGGEAENYDYGIWMAEPISIKERCRSLLQGMGLTSSRDLVVSKNGRMPSCRSRAPSTRFTSAPSIALPTPVGGGPTSSLPPLPTKPLPPKSVPEPQPRIITRRRSDGAEEVVGDSRKPRWRESSRCFRLPSRPPPLPPENSLPRRRCCCRRRRHSTA